MQQQDRDDPLRWLSAVLWPDGATEIARGDRGQRTWWASPSVDEPRILIPADAPAAARVAVRRYHDGFDPTRRAKSLLAEATMAVPGLAGLALRGSKVAERLSGPERAPGSMNALVESPSGPERAPGLIDALAERLDQPDLVVAISLSVPKSNRKPVLQLLTPDGRCLGWAKVGWGPISDRLVGNEASWLDRSTVGRRTSDALAVPRLLDDAVLAGRRVVVTSAFEADRRPSRRPDAPPPLEVFRAVADRGTVDTVPVVESAWWRSVEAALVGASPQERAAVDAVAEAASGRRIEVGAWHGDLTPWNLLTIADVTQLIDWELAADGVPFGFDLCHFHTQVGAEMKGLAAAGALDRSARLSPQGLAGLGVCGGNHSLVWRLYLVELVRRLLVLRGEGYPTEHLHHGPAALARLSAMAGRQARQAQPTPTATVAG